RTTIKPTPSISISQKTVNIKTLQPTSIKIRGRHDTIIALRAVPVIESATAIVILDHAIRSHIIPPIIK
ncbi:MAG: chorismate synthase, partial [Candidatus Helarchaeota archaeon]